MLPNSFNLLQAYIKALKLPPEARDGIKRSPEWKALFKRLAKTLTGDAKTEANNIMNNYDEVNSLAETASNGEQIAQEAFDSVRSRSGDGGEFRDEPPEGKVPDQPPNNKRDWQDTLKKVGLSTGLNSSRYCVSGSV